MDESNSPETPLLGTQRQQNQAELRLNRNHSAQSHNETNEGVVAPMATDSAQENAEGNDHYRPRRILSFYYRRAVTVFTAVLVDERGTGWPVVLGLFLLVLMGIILGIILPGDADLPSKHGYRFLSNAIGYTYFMSWSVSFYPQVISNFRRKSTLGLSPDFCGLNVIGFTCYTIYNLGLFFVPAIQAEYRARHGPDASISVQSNDVAFAVHALCLASVTFFQIGYYNGFRGSSSPSKVILAVSALFVSTILVGPLVVLTVKKIEWLDYLYLLGNIKVLITLMKYIPQVILNFRRQSTTGWSIWNILLDFTGGTLSDVQLVLDCAAMNDWTGITGNLTKLALGSVSVVFDLVFMAQHYILYPRRDDSRSQSMSDDADGNLPSDLLFDEEPLPAIDDRTL